MEDDYFAVLGSGSSGNATFLHCGGARVLIDCGLSCTRITDGLEELSIGLDDIDAIFLTHEHSDHVRGLQRVLGKRSTPIQVFGTRGTLNAVRENFGEHEPVVLKRGSTQTILGLDVTAFAISHDASEPCGYRFDSAKMSFANATDMGVWNDGVVEALTGLDALVLEFNHDLDMLRRGPYPHFLKRRVSGRSGHLSNWQAAQLLSKVVSSELQHVVLAHLSDKNNTAQLALEAAAEVASGVSLVAAQQSVSTGKITTTARPNPKMAGRQLALF